MYWITGIIGMFMVVAPFILGYAENPTAFWTSGILGFLVLVLSVWEGAQEDRADWEYWFAGIIGIFAIFAPFLLGFGTHITAMWTSIITGIVVAIIAGSRLWTGKTSGT